MTELELLDAAPDGVIVLDASHRVRYANGAASRLLAMDRSEIESFVRHLPLQAGATDAPVQLQINARTLRLHVRRRADVVALYLHDVSELERTARVLRDRDSQIERVLRATGAAAYDLDLQVGLTYTDPNFGSFFGYAPGEAPARWADFEKHFDPDDLSAVQNAARESLRTGQPYRRDCRVTGADGTVRWLRIAGDVRADANGVPERSSGLITDVTSERAVAEALQESERQLNVAQQIAGIGSWTWNIRTNEVQWSPEMYRIQGFDPALTSPSFDLVLSLAVDDARRTEFTERLQRALDGEDAYDFEIPIRRADGALRLLHTRGAVERDVDGHAVRMTGTAEDITERRRAEESLRLAERELYRAQRMARIGSFVRSIDTGVVWWSPTTRAILEVPDGVEATLDLALSRFPKSEADRYVTMMTHALESGEPYELESETVMPSGRLVSVRLAGEIDRDGNGRQVSVHGTIADLTAQRAQERALRESEERFRTLWEASPIGIRLADVNGRSLYANPRLLEMFDCTWEEFRSERWRERIHPDDRERVAREGRDSVVNVRDKRVDYRVVRPDGRVRYVRATIAIIRAPDGSFGGHVGALEDLTEETETRQEKERLEQQMHQAQKLESLGVLAGGIAHDFNNLLVGVLTNATIALMDLAPDSPAYDTVRDIERAAQRAADLTRQLLAYSGKGRFIIEPLSLSELAVEMTQLLRTVVSKRASLHLDLQHELPLVRGDSTQLRQVVMNLITNASDSLGEGEGQILLRTRLVEVGDGPPGPMVFGGPLHQGAHVVLEVADTGAGMDEETVRKIFDPFFTTKFTGRGLGLAATIGIVRGHDGAVAVSSTPGHGTTFSLYFPVTTAARRATTSSPATEIAGHGSILVVDDDDGVRAVARSLLQRQGFEVLSATNGREALEVYAEHREQIRAVLLDLTMPVMGGEEALRRLRAADPLVRVVLMSGYSDMDVEGTFAGAGLSGFLQKPFRADDVYRALAVALAEH